MFREVEKQKENFFIDPRVRIDTSSIEGAGVGCFAAEDIPARTIIESCPVILFSPDTLTYLNQIHNVLNLIVKDSNTSLFTY